jgi:hypothetical protein
LPRADFAAYVNAGVVIPRTYEFATLIGLIFDAREDGDVPAVGIRAVVVGAEAGRIRVKTRTRTISIRNVRAPICRYALKHTTDKRRNIRNCILTETDWERVPCYFPHLVDLERPDLPPNVDAGRAIPHP